MGPVGPMGPPGPSGSGTSFSAASCIQYQSNPSAVISGSTMSASCPAGTYVVTGAPVLTIWDQAGMCFPGQIILTANSQKLITRWLGTCSANWSAYVWVLCCP